MGLTWSFESDSGAVAAEVRARFAANDSRVLLSAALTGLGIAVLPQFLAREALGRGQLVPVLPDYPLTPIWFKAMVPRNKVHHPVVAALVDHLKGEFGPRARPGTAERASPVHERLLLQRRREPVERLADRLPVRQRLHPAEPGARRSGSWRSPSG